MSNQDSSMAIAQHLDIEFLNKCQKFINDMDVHIKKGPGKAEPSVEQIQSWPTPDEFDKQMKKLQQLLDTPFYIDFLAIILPTLIQAHERGKNYLSTQAMHPT